MSFEMQNI